MSISANYGPPAPRDQGIKVIRAAHEKGVTFFDTAEVYGPFTNEDLVGEALAPIREKFISQPNLVLTLKLQVVVSIAGQSRSRKSLTNR